LFLSVYLILAIEQHVLLLAGESLFKHYINNKKSGVNLFELNSSAIDELLSERKTIPRVPFVNYYVIAVLFKSQ